MHGDGVSISRGEVWGERLALGFGMAAAMWGFGFIGRLPGLEFPAIGIFILLHIALLIGGRFASSPIRAAQGGLIAGCVNLLILGAVMRDMDGTFNPYAMLWVPGTMLWSAGVAALGRMLGHVGLAHTDGNPWLTRFGIVAIGTTLLLIGVGGSVTGYEAGMAVYDWPNSFGYNMFLFPLAKMTGGVYYEHAHRLLGSLVGLTTLVFAALVVRNEQRLWLRALACVAFLMVCVQGLLGGLRVTEDDRVLAMIHGTLAQVFLATLVFLTCALSPLWQNWKTHAGSVSRMGVAAILLLLAQIIFGVILRHTAAQLTWALHTHIALAFIVALIVGWFGIRCWATTSPPPVERLGATIVWILGGQMLLGFLALAAIMFDPTETGTAGWQVLITTTHQTTGAILLATTVATVAWRYRCGLDRPVPTSVHEPVTT